MVAIDNNNDIEQVIFRVITSEIVTDIQLLFLPMLEKVFRKLGQDRNI